MSDQVVLDNVPPTLYGPLGATDIRILDIHPSASDSDIVECEIKQLSLAKAARNYKALSYRWGDESKRATIVLAGLHINVTRSLESALRQLRSFEINQIWVDAICINQNDIQERNAQVLRMRAIYLQAEAVVVWLGPRKDDPDTIMTLVSELCDRTQGVNTGSGYNLRVYDFFRNPYWQRTWIIQEITVAHTVLVAWGSILVPLDGLEKALPTFIMRLRNDWQQGRNLSLLEAIEETRTSKTKVIHDKIFGLLGITSDGFRFVPDPDYQISERELCISMTQAYIWSTSLDIILLRGFRSRSSPTSLERSLPSWVPDYLSPSMTMDDRLIRYITKADNRFRSGRLRPMWQATGRSKARATFAEIAPRDPSLWSKFVLRSRAYYLGQIVSFGDLASLARALCTQATREKFDPRLRVSDWAIMYALIRMHFAFDEAYERHSQYFGSHAASAVYDNNILKVFVTMYPSEADFVQNSLHIADVKALEDRRSFCGNAWRPSWSEGLGRLMLLSEGRIGRACSHAELNDSVFLLQGCSVPVILRWNSRQNTYIVVGDAVVDRVMDGEFWKELRDDSFGIVDIV